MPTTRGTKLDNLDNRLDGLDTRLDLVSDISFITFLICVFLAATIVFWYWYDPRSWWISVPPYALVNCWVLKNLHVAFEKRGGKK